MNPIATEIIQERGNTRSAIAKFEGLHLPYLPNGSIITMNSTQYQVSRRPSVAVSTADDRTVTLHVYVTELA
jgi:hypothetical protein